jgi:hypothetical protein
MRRALVFALVAATWAMPVRAQSPPPAPAAPVVPVVNDPPLRRWLDVQNFTVFSRYRFAANSKDATTSDQLQYRDTFRARFNIDPEKRYTINVGFFSGNSFIGGWDNWGVGNNTTLDGKDNYVKQLYASAAPLNGLELQYGGIYVNRGETDEFISYDDDGYLVGERVSVRRARELYLDEISVTRAAIGPLNTPNLGSRWDGLKNPNYTQLLGAKRIGKMIGASIDYTRQSGADTFRAAVTLHFSKDAPVGTVRYEQYRRVNAQPAAGFGLWAERAVTKHARVQGGYMTVDQFYGGLNGDRMLSGRRFFAIGTFSIYGPLGASIYVTHALSSPYTVSVARRLDAVVSYDVLDSLRRTHIF